MSLYNPEPIGQEPEPEKKPEVCRFCMKSDKKLLLNSEREKVGWSFS
jgi:hypothetical protein